MRLRNKKTGEVVEFEVIELVDDDEIEFTYVNMSGHEQTRSYRSLKKFNEEWGDHEEPKKYWYVTGEGDICRDDIKYSEWIEERKSIGNYFETNEEAEKAVKKLKAWKRLKDKGFRFDGVEAFSEGLLEIDAVLPAHEKAAGAERLKIGVLDDLWLLFGGEENETTK